MRIAVIKRNFATFRSAIGLISKRSVFYLILINFIAYARALLFVYPPPDSVVSK